ncbi:MAG: hypothetical protein WEB00_11705 [Dehalococcoidia bacterium]
MLRAAWVLLSLLALTLVGCGGGDSGDDEATAQPTDDSTPTEEPGPDETPVAGDAAPPDVAGLQNVTGLPFVAQGRSLVAGFQALAVSAEGDRVFYRLTLGSNTENFDSVALTIEYDGDSVDFAGLLSGVDPTAGEDICSAGAANCDINEDEGVVQVFALEPLQGRVFTTPDDTQLQQGESIDIIAAFTLAGNSGRVQVSVAAGGAAGEDVVGPIGEGFVYEPGDFGIDGSFPGDVPQIEDTVSPRVFLTNQSGQALQNVALSYIASQPPGLEFLTGSCNTDVRATLPFGELPTIATLPDLEFCFTNESFSSGRQLQIEASFKAADPAALAAGVRVLLVARGKDGNGFIRLSELVEITR